MLLFKFCVFLELFKGFLVIFSVMFWFVIIIGCIIIFIFEMIVFDFLFIMILFFVL